MNVFFKDDFHGFVITESSLEVPVTTHMYKTSDRGKTWKYLSNKVDSIDINNSFVSAPMYYDPSGTVFIEIQNGTAISLDTGFTWHFRPLSKVGRVQTASFISPDNLLVFGGDPFRGSNPQLIISHDTGQNFETIGNPAPSTDRTTITACIQDTNNIWFGARPHGGAHAYLTRTTDAGETWEEISPVADTNLLEQFDFEIIKGAAKNSVYLASNSQLVINAQRYDFLVTIDNGQTWVGSSANNGKILLNSALHEVLHNPRGKELWCLLDDHHTLGYSSDNGNNWVYDSITFNKDNLTDMIWQDSLKGFIFGYQDSTVNLYTYSQPNSTPFIINYFDAPFKIIPSITTNIFHLIPIKSLNGFISIHDIFGRTLLQEHIQGVENVPIDYSLSEYAVGVYCISYFSGDYAVFFKVIKN